MWALSPVVAGPGAFWVPSGCLLGVFWGSSGACPEVGGDAGDGRQVRYSRIAPVILIVPEIPVDAICPLYAR